MHNAPADPTSPAPTPSAPGTPAVLLAPLAATVSIADYAARGALYFGDQLAVVDVAKGEAGRFTYRQMQARAERLAGWLRDTAGVGRGDRVGILAQNGVEYLDTLLACAKLGAIFVPYNFRLHPRELAAVVNQTAPRALLFSTEFTSWVETLRTEAPALAHYVHLDEAPATDVGSRPYAPLVAPPQVGETASPPLAPADITPEDTLCLLFTGGTTGLPKAAQVSYRMVAWNTLTTTLHELQRGDVTVVHTPMFHTGGLLVYTLPLLQLGGTVVIMRRWDVEQLLSLIERERVTMFFAVPTQYQMLLQSPKLASTRLDSVRFVTSGGAPLPVTVLDAFRAVHPVPFKQGFGMTEFGPGCFSMGPEFAVAKAGSIGRPNTYVAARVVDDEGQPLPPGEAGELVLKGPAMFSGYYQDAGATAAVIDADGWFHTGDVARTDEDGFYYIVDRKKDMFISGGENVYPVEIERALYEHPAVHQCAVIGIPDEKWGQVGRAFVVLRPGQAATADELLGHLRARLARYKVPKSVVIQGSLPTSPAGKILKRELPAG